MKIAFLLIFFVKLILSNTLHGVSSASAGDDCILIWFWQDVPIDVNQFLVPEDYDILLQLHDLCTMIPVIIGPDAKTDKWKKFVANLQPGLRGKYAKDSDYSGAFYLEEMKDLMSDEFSTHLNNYLCLVKHRATCRIFDNGFLGEASVGSPTQMEPTAKN